MSKQIFGQFCEDHFALPLNSYVGLQQSYGFGSDLLIFNWGRETLAVPITLLEEPRPVARDFIKKKLQLRKAS